VQPSTMQVDWVRYYPIPGVTVENLGTTSGTGAPLARIAGGDSGEATGGDDGGTTVTPAVDPAPTSPPDVAVSATTPTTEPEPAAV